MMCKLTKLSAAEAFDWLSVCDEKFIPPKWSEGRLRQYADKLACNAHWITLADDVTSQKMGCCAYYLNEENQFAYISIIAIAKAFRGRGYGKQLIQQLVENVSGHFKYILLEVSKSNERALGLYCHYEFEIIEDRCEKFLMQKEL